MRRTAEIGFTPLRRSAEHGFTLIELMVVIAIMGLATSVVVLSMPDSNGRVRREAEGLAARMLAARDDAIIQGRDVAIWVEPQGSGFERRRRGAWLPVRERPLQPASFAAGTVALVPARQRIVFGTTGAASPVTITLARGERRASIKIDASGAIRVGS